MPALIIENEGPRPPFRVKLKRKAEHWDGPAIDGRISVLERPWASFSFATQEWRAALARGHRFDVANAILRQQGIEPTFVEHDPKCIKHPDNRFNRLHGYNYRCDAGCPRAKYGADKPIWPEWIDGEVFDAAYRLEGAQRLAIDLRVDRGRRRAAVTQHLPDLAQRRARAQHLGRRGVAQPVAADAALKTGLAPGGRDDRRDPVCADRPGRRPAAQEHVRLARRARVAQMGRQRLADVARQRQRLLAGALAADEDLARAPVDVAELERGDLAAAQPEPRQQLEDREVALPDRVRAIAGREQPLDLARLQRL